MPYLGQGTFCHIWGKGPYAIFGARDLMPYLGQGTICHIWGKGPYAIFGARDHMPYLGQGTICHIWGKGPYAIFGARDHMPYLGQGTLCQVFSISEHLQCLIFAYISFLSPCPIICVPTNYTGRALSDCIELL